MVARLETDEKVVGLKQVKRAISLEEAKIVYIAKDVDDFIKQDVLKECQDKGIQIIQVETMDELGSACGIDVSAAIAALL